MKMIYSMMELVMRIMMTVELMMMVMKVTSSSLDYSISMIEMITSIYL
jgi:hypothetical protein